MYFVILLAAHPLPSDGFTSSPSDPVVLLEVMPQHLQETTPSQAVLLGPPGGHVTSASIGGAALVPLVIETCSRTAGRQPDRRERVLADIRKSQQAA